MISLMMSSFFGCWDRFICLMATSRPVDTSMAMYTVPDALGSKVRALYIHPTIWQCTQCQTPWGQRSEHYTYTPPYGNVHSARCPGVKGQSIIHTPHHMAMYTVLDALELKRLEYYTKHARTHAHTSLWQCTLCLIPWSSKVRCLIYQHIINTYGCV